MQLKLRSQDDFLLATVTGQLSLIEALLVGKNVIDAATEQGLNRILMDCSAMTGELPDLERYQLGKAMAEYCASKSVCPKVAVIGKPPAVNGFVAEVASNRGLTTGTFSESQSALEWLKRLTCNFTATNRQDVEDVVEQRTLGCSVVLQRVKRRPAGFVKCNHLTVDQYPAEQKRAPKAASQATAAS